ncbi:MAG: hypothetical protein Hals2KO_21420 [Halioglobus sp.]
MPDIKKPASCAGLLLQWGLNALRMQTGNIAASQLTGHNKTRQTAGFEWLFSALTTFALDSNIFEV